MVGILIGIVFVWVGLFVIEHGDFVFVESVGDEIA
jgi:hypothetical protein